ncbi:hypothetical protein HPB50_027377 [Hyalomma asiaticum]|uniref:Uncharacterized protein n=1 Tax=Hyalomma asiaticum TaxID=266040 RepID=A0ACB7TS32_HYAAI|nr:hypothetical protein HPB50_027377 [Hyalomma asiaticum]
MARPKPPLNIPKYKGTPEDVPINKWLRLFDMKASKASCTHRDQVSHFSECIEGEAFKWYLTEIFSNVKTWDYKEARPSRNTTKKKKRLGSLADLKECHIISGLADGVPPDVELALARLSFKMSSEWLATAQWVETSLRRFHWRNECPRRGSVSTIETGPGNEEGDPEFYKYTSLLSSTEDQ